MLFVVEDDTPVLDVFNIIHDPTNFWICRALKEGHKYTVLNGQVSPIVRVGLFDVFNGVTTKRQAIVNCAKLLRSIGLDQNARFAE